jgi:hypothetical protein
MNQKQKSALAVYGILVVVYNVCYFAIPFPKTGAAWISYVFTWIAFGVSLYSLKIAFDGAEELESKVYGFPVVRIGYLYMAAQVVFGLLICLLGYGVKVSTWIPLVVSVLLLGLTLIGMIAADVVRGTVEKTVEKTRQQTSQMKYFKLDAAGLSDMAQGDTLKTAVIKLEEDIRYSDPVSNDALVGIEERLQREMDFLRGMLTSGGEEKAVLEQVQKVRNLVSERNRLCKAGKK